MLSCSVSITEYRHSSCAGDIISITKRDFLEAGRKRLAGDTVREATSGEVKDLRKESLILKEALAELLMENRLLKKSMIGDGEGDI